MGSIVVYDSKMDRFKGMSEAGERLKENLKDHNEPGADGFRAAVIKTVDTLLDDKYIVRYEFQKKKKGEGDSFRRNWILRKKKKSGGNQEYDLYNKNGILKGSLNLSISIDSDGDTEENFTMNITVPRRSNNRKSWRYLNDILSDLGKKKPYKTKDRNYLTGLVTFSRCR